MKLSLEEREPSISKEREPILKIKDHFFKNCKTGERQRVLREKMSVGKGEEFETWERERKNSKLEIVNIKGLRKGLG